MALSFGPQPIITAAGLAANATQQQQALQQAMTVPTAPAASSTSSTQQQQPAGPLPLGSIVTACYTQILGHPPTPDDISYIGQTLQTMRNQGSSDSDLVGFMVNRLTDRSTGDYQAVLQQSTNNQNQVIAAQVYTSAYGQPPSPDVLQHYVDLSSYYARNGLTPDQIAARLQSDMTQSGTAAGNAYQANLQNQQLYGASQSQQTSATNLVNQMLGIPTNGTQQQQQPTDPYSQLLGSTYGQNAMYATTQPYYVGSQGDPLASLSQYFPTTYSGGGGSYGGGYGTQPSSLPYSSNMPDYSSLFGQATNSFATMQQQMQQQQQYMSGMFGGSNNLSSFISGTTQGFGSLGLTFPTNLNYQLPSYGF